MVRTFSSFSRTVRAEFSPVLLIMHQKLSWRDEGIVEDGDSISEK